MIIFNKRQSNKATERYKQEKIEEKKKESFEVMDVEKYSANKYICGIVFFFFHSTIS